MSEMIAVTRLLELARAHPPSDVSELLATALLATDELLIPINAARSSDLHAIYQVRWRRIQDTGVPASLGVAEFVAGLSDDTGPVWMFALRADGWLFVGYLSDDLLELGGVHAVRSEP